MERKKKKIKRILYLQGTICTTSTKVFMVTISYTPCLSLFSRRNALGIEKSHSHLACASVCVCLFKGTRPEKKIYEVFLLTSFQDHPAGITFLASLASRTLPVIAGHNFPLSGREDGAACPSCSEPKKRPRRELSTFDPSSTSARFVAWTQVENRKQNSDQIKHDGL